MVGSGARAWLLVLSGSAVAGAFDIATGDALFVQLDRIDIHSGAIGIMALVAYTGGGPAEKLLQRLATPNSIDVGRAREIQTPTYGGRAKAVQNDGGVEAIK